MADHDYEIDPEMLSDFIDESLDALSVIPGLFVDLEANPGEVRILEAAFRPIHSLKGNAAYFGLLNIKALAHDLESVLDMLRKMVLLPNRQIIDGLLAGIDELQHMLEHTRTHGTDSEVKRREEELATMFRSVSTAQASPPLQTVDQEGPWQEILHDLSALGAMPALMQGEPASRLAALKEKLLSLAPHHLVPANEPCDVFLSDSNPVEALERLLNDGVPGMNLAMEGECVLKLLKRIEAMAVTEEARANIAKSLEEFDIFVSRIGYDPMLKEFLIEGVETLKTAQEWVQVEPPPAPVATPPQVQVEEAVAVARTEDKEPVESGDEQAAQKRVSAKLKDSGRTMRISEERVDVFLSYVGELIAVDEMLRYIHSEMDRREVDQLICSSLLRIVNTFSKLSNDLQNSIMGIRRVSVKPLLQKAQRIVRDIASANGKLIDTVIEGEDVTVDRSLVETLEIPMVHMVRNAADHGVELPGQRLGDGKSERGTITVSMSETEEMIVLSIADDGKGLNYASIQEKAISMGLLKKGAPITEEILVNVIFASGFSTAETVTDVSGRGVGMDAVKRSVEDAGGFISVHTTQGLGSEFRVSLPKSVGTQILDSFVVQVGDDRFVLPMDKISGSFKPSGQFTRLPGGTVCVKRNDGILPVINLDGPYTGDIDKLDQGILVRIENKGRPFVFYVDTILGMQKVVLRNIPWINAEKFLGAAIMGDGRVSMIVDIEFLGQSVAGLETK